MERIGVRDLQHHAGRYIQRVKAGETVAVTERGELVALLTPPTSSAVRDHLVATGRLIPAEGLRRFGARRPLPPAGPSSAEVLDDLRQERI